MGHEGRGDTQSISDISAYLYFFECLSFGNARDLGATDPKWFEAELEPTSNPQARDPLPGQPSEDAPPKKKLDRFQEHSWLRPAPGRVTCEEVGA